MIGITGYLDSIYRVARNMKRGPARLKEIGVQVFQNKCCFRARLSKLYATVILCETIGIFWQFLTSTTPISVGKGSCLSWSQRLVGYECQKCVTITQCRRAGK